MYADSQDRITYANDSLIALLRRHERAIMTHIPGLTRQLVGTNLSVFNPQPPKTCIAAIPHRTASIAP